VDAAISILSFHFTTTPNMMVIYLVYKLVHTVGTTVPEEVFVLSQLWPCHGSIG
jgi:hypothetical protein